ncbi:hypothetical protein ACTA71_003065 [Dictyostelium dimigraforme]
MMKKIFISIFLFFLLVCVVFSNNDQPSKIIKITDENSDLLLTGNWLFKLGATWSAHCKKLQPILEKIAQHFNIENSKVKVAQVDCPQYNSICEKYKIIGYPTIKLIKEGETEEYGGQKNFDGIVQFINEHLE